MNEETTYGRVDYFDKCSACGRDLRQKPTSSCEENWHHHAYERYKESAKIRNRKSRALLHAERVAKGAYR